MQNSETQQRAKEYAIRLRDAAPRSQPLVVAYTTSLNSFGPGDRRAAIVAGYAVWYVDRHDARCLAVWRTDFGPPGTRRYGSATDAAYLIDDGTAVRGHYVAGWARADGPLWLAPYRVHSSGARPATHRPRVAYHVILSAVPALDDWHWELFGDAAPLSRVAPTQPVLSGLALPAAG